ncbi:Hypothetical predicted protein, partial [Marmota monax]
GLLRASAHFGAYVNGIDIDYNTVHGLGKACRKNQQWRGPDENIRANLSQSDLEKYYLDALVSDASQPSWKKGIYFDAIISDPPYGETIVLGRTLVYWLPVYTPEYTEEMVPLHPCMKLISNFEQKLSNHTTRLLITMEK